MPVTVSLVASNAGGLFLLADEAGYNAAPSTTALPSAISTAIPNTMYATATRGAAFAPQVAPFVGRHLAYGGLTGWIWPPGPPGPPDGGGPQQEEGRSMTGQDWMEKDFYATLGVPDETGEVMLIGPDREVPIGGRLY